MADIDVTIGADSSQYQSELKKAQAANDNFNNNTKKMGLSASESFALITTGVAAAIQIIDRLAGALRAPIEAFREAELAGNKLTLALENQGLSAGEVSARYRDMADALQEKTGVDDDAIISNLALLQSFVGQQEIGDELALTMVNLAERTGSMESAAEILGRAIQGNTRGLKQFGVSIDETGTQAERTAELIEKFGIKVGGAAEAAGKGLGGVRGLESAFSDLLEVIGEQLAPVVSDAVVELTKLIKALAQSPEVKIISKAFADSLNRVLIIVRSLIEAFRTVGTAAVDGINKAVDATKKFFGIKGAPSSAGAAAAPEKPTIDPQEEARLAALKKAADQEQAERTRIDQEKLEERRQFNELILTQNDEFQALSAEQQEIFLEQNQEQLNKAFLTTQEAQAQSINQQLTAQVNANNRYLLEQQKFGQAYATINRVIYSEQVQGAGKAATELSQLQKSNNATLKAIGKAAAVTDITIKTAQSAMNIYAGFSTIPIVGPFLGIAGAAAAVAFGAEQIGQVLSAQQGGIVPGLNKGMDSVPSMLQPGELVVPRNSFSEVVSAVADRRAQQTGESDSVSATAQASGGFTATLEFSGDNAEKFLTARQVEARSLGTLREAAA